MSPSNLNTVLSLTTLYVLIVTTAFFETAFSQECWERDEVAAGRRCKRACHPDGSCRKQNKECVCDGLCGPSCFYKRCPPLTEPMNGSIEINPTDRTIGAEVTYSCRNGYVISGQPTRVCQANKTWSGTEPTCTESTTRVRQVCPVRDEVEAGRNCERACQPDDTCRKQNKECVCDGLCGLTCFKKRCSPLTPIRNGNLAIESEVRTIGSQATYSCNSGFVLSGPRIRQCRANKRWSGTQPACIRSTPSAQSTNDGLCPRLELNGGTLEYRDGNNRIVEQPLHGNTRTAMCSEGYVLNGMAQSLCSFGIWQEELPNCERVSCKTLDLEDGALAYLNENNERIHEPKHGDIRIAFCNDGRILRGASQTQCISGSWQNELPSCEIDQVRCHQPPEVENTAHNGTKAYYGDGDIVIYKCEYGYSGRGSLPLSRCNGGEWSEIQLQCSLIQCNRPEEPTNGHSDADLESYGYEGTVSFDCDPGYILKGSSIITCNEHGQWSPPPPLCLGQCRIPSCPRNWHWTLNGTSRYINCYHNNNRMVNPGTRLTYHCSNGYFKCQQMEPVCRNGDWEPTLLNLCKEIGCTSLTLLDPQLTARYTYPGGTQCIHSTYYQRQTVVEYSCNLGYKIRDGDPSRAICRERNWLPQQKPRCEEVTCPHIQLDNGAVNYQRNGPFISIRGHTAIAQLRCYPGYMLEGHTLSCYNGTWNDTSPRCVGRPCSVSSLGWYDNMNIQYEIPPESDDIAEENKPAGTTAVFICREHGFEASETKRCVRGSWTGGQPVCSRIPCDHEALLNGEVAYTLDGDERPLPVHGVIRTYNCNSGFIMNDEEPSECDAGTWTRRLPTCNERRCNTNDLLSSDWDIEYNYQGQRDNLAEEMKSSGTVARFTCSHFGYEIVGPSTRTCRQGRWSGQNPSCVRRSCNKDDLLDGVWEWEIQYTNLGGRDELDRFASPETVATIACGTFGYETTGDNTRTCRRGEWSGENPSCVRVPCQPFQLTNGMVRYFSIDNTETSNPRHGDIFRLTCRTGYDAMGPAQTLCWNGQWNNEEPFCQEKPCNKDDLLDGRWEWEIQYTNVGGRDGTDRLASPDTVATIECSSFGYETSGDNTRRCRRGEWSGTNPSCQRDTCPTEAIENGEVKTEDSRSFIQVARHGDFRLFSCDPGYEIDGEERSQCNHGEWTNEKPTCIVAFCKTPTVANGIFTRSALSQFSEDASHGEFGRFKCNDGYTPTEIIWFQCVSGQWSQDLPTCEPARCPTIENSGEYASIRYHGSESEELSFIHGTILEMECAEGRVAEGPTISICRLGQWEQPIGRCVHNAPCQEVTEELGRTVAYSELTSGEKRHNSNLNVTCGERLVRFGQSTATCSNGAWLPAVAHCKENFALGRPTDQVSMDFDGVADRAVDGITSGIYDDESCTHTSRHSYNQWWYVDLGSTVLVEDILIYNRQDGNHGDRLLSAKVRIGDQTHVTSNQVVGVVNNTDINPIHIVVRPPIEGRIISVSELPLQQPLTLCEVQVFGEHRGCSIGCEVPFIENGHYTIGSTNGRQLQPGECVQPNQYIFVKCLQNLAIRGTYFYRCQASGEWYKEHQHHATCRVCPENECVVPNIENGEYISETNGPCTQNNQLYLYLRCLPGTERVGRHYYRCSEGELLTGNPGNSLTSCTEVRCHQPPEIANAAHNGTKAYYVEGDIVMYSCHYGYYRSGSLPLLRCDGDEWSDIQFQCSPRCPAIVNNGRYARILYHGSESNASTFQTGTMVEVVCAGGTVAEGATLSTCNLGRWDPPIGQCVHTDYSECGIAKNTVSRGRIVGGNNANPGAWPWQVYLDITRGNLQKSCGGVLIDRYWVLTTAACISNAPDYRITAVLGMTYLDRPRLQEIQIEEAVVHPNYSQTNVQNDIALLKLNRSAELNEFVRIVCLPDKTRANQLIPRNPSMRHAAIVTGWGLLNARNINDLSSRQPATQLQQLAVPMKSREDCLRSLQGKPEFQFFDAGMFCAGYSNARRGPCIDDAGGPIIRKVAQNMQRRWVLIGLTSWGRGCAVPGELDFFTNVPYFMDWITESMRQVEAK